MMMWMLVALFGVSFLSLPFSFHSNDLAVAFVPPYVPRLVKGASAFHRRRPSITATSRRGKKNNANEEGKSTDGSETWDELASPFTILRYYAKYGVADGLIQARLEKHEVTSLEQLLQKFSLFATFIRVDASEELICFLAAIIGNRTKMLLAENKGNEADVAPTITKIWDGLTSPSTFIRFYAQEIITDDEIQARLKKHKVTSLEQLPRKFPLFATFIRVDASEELICILAAIIGNRTKMNPTEFLAENKRNEADFVSTTTKVQLTASTSKQTPTAVPDGPDSWNAETTPFTVVKYYAKDGVTDEQIESSLDKYAVTSLQQLPKKYLLLASLLRVDDAGEELLDSVNAALIRTKAKPTELLAGELDFDKECIDDHVLTLFSPEAVSVNANRVPPTKEAIRFPKYSLVLGPSGSGKTMFCLLALPPRVFPAEPPLKKMYRVHVTADKLLRRKRATSTLSGLLVEYVREKIASRLSKDYATNTDVPPIDLHLYVVIDEAGSPKYKKYFDEAGKISDLTEALRGMQDYKFLKKVHVVVTGASLETSTDAIPSHINAVKYRMRPWSRSNFHALLAKLNRFDQAEVKAIVDQFPILESLTTNGRCAYYLATTLPNISYANEDQWADHIPASVAYVAQCYVGSNALGRLTSLPDKFAVAQGVFKALNEAMADPSKVKLPTFDDIENANLRPVAQSLLDINVEIRDKTAKLMTAGEYAVSMTPAITIVLAELLCQKARIRWDWQSCEATAALGELKCLITEMNPSDYTNASGIMYMRGAIPAGRATKRFTLPVVGRATVVVNEHLAPYADVMAPFRLVKTKFSADVDSDIPVNFAEEVGKMGLMKTTTTTRAKTGSTYRLQQAITSVLYKMWQTRDNEDRKVRFERWGSYKKAISSTGEKLLRFVYYPYDSLLFAYVPIYDMAHFKIADDCFDVLCDGNNAKERAEANKLINTAHPIKVLEEFSEDLPVTAVFVTNARSFVFEIDEEIRNHTVSRDDVNWQGELKKPLPEDFVKDLREHVNIRFIFYGE